MRIKRFTLVNFRGIAEMTLDFTETTTAIVGVNGVGKSSVLDALAIGLSNLAARVAGRAAKSRAMSPDDISLGAEYARLDMTVQLGDRPEIEWRIVLNRKAGDHPAERRSDFSQLREVTQNLAIEAGIFDAFGVDATAPAAFPLAVYYDVHRAVLDVPLRVRERLKNAIVEGYEDALGHGGADFKRFFIWFRNQEDLENEKARDIAAYRDPELTAVREAVKVFTGFTDLRIRRKPSLRMTLCKDSKEFNVAQLSDGEKCLLAMVGDLARRLTLLNRNVNEPLRGAGVVLIDELDLHLHPAWQRTVVANLQNTFPRCQFIISTHSPQILGELPASAIMLLKNGRYIGHPERALGLNSGEVLEEFMGGQAQNVQVSRQLDRINECFDDDDLTSAQQKLNELRQQVGDIPDVLQLQSSLESLALFEGGDD